jgi:uncharacterized protein YkwD
MVMTGVLALGLSGCLGVGGSTVHTMWVERDGPRRPATVNSAEAVAAVSAYRASRGLPPVSLDPTLTAIARDHADRMAAMDRLDHVLPGEGSFEQRVESHGYNAGVAAENIGAGYADLAEAMAGWKASPGHNANLLRQGVTRIGIAVAWTPRGRFGNYWSIVLAAPAERRSMSGPDAGPPAALFAVPR